MVEYYALFDSAMTIQYGQRGLMSIYHIRSYANNWSYFRIIFDKIWLFTYRRDIKSELKENEATNHDDLLDAFRMSLQFWR